MRVTTPQTGTVTMRISGGDESLEQREPERDGRPPLHPDQDQAVAGQPEEKVHKLFRYAHALGADKKLWKPEQFARMPDARRDNGNRQAVLFFNPQPLCVHAD